MEKTGTTVKLPPWTMPEQPDYMSFVDEDIRQMFEGKSCLHSDILMAQLIKELRKLNETRK